jgi:hypothetical protein
MVKEVLLHKDAAITYIRDLGFSGPDQHSKSGKALNAKETLHIADQLGLDGVFEVRNADHTEIVIDLYERKGKYILLTYDPNGDIEEHLLRPQDESCLYPTYQASKYCNLNGEKAIIGRTSDILTRRYFPHKKPTPEERELLKQLGDINEALDCAALCIYVQTIREQLRKTGEVNVWDIIPGNYFQAVKSHNYSENWGFGEEDPFRSGAEEEFWETLVYNQEEEY